MLNADMTIMLTLIHGRFFKDFKVTKRSSQSIRRQTSRSAK
jgi:hypothetical protein